MTKLELLFIRACKTNDPRTRVYSVYNRFYALKASENQWAIVNILAKIAMEQGMTISDLIYAQESDNHSKWHNEAKPMVASTRDALINYLRFLNVQNIDGWVAPAWFRRQD